MVIATLSHTDLSVKQEMQVGIAVMCKPPRVGVSKTRLAAAIGAAAAAQLSEAFLRDVTRTVATVVSAMPGTVPFAVYAPADAEAEIRALVPADFQLILQSDAGLGQLMMAAIATVLEQCPGGCILMGADMPSLPPPVLSDAIAQLRLRATDLVLAPTADGGYCLIGAKAVHPSLFTGIPWSTSVVLEQTLARAVDATLGVTLLPPCLDVDDHASLNALVVAIAQGTVPDDDAPFTRAALKHIGLLQGCDGT
jgi:uncharacterized protein